MLVHDLQQFDTKKILNITDLLTQDYVCQIKFSLLFLSTVLTWNPNISSDEWYPRCKSPTDTEILASCMRIWQLVIFYNELSLFFSTSGGREGGQARWHCYEVRVSESGGGCKYTFPCNKWIRVSEDQDVNDAVILSVDSEKTEESKITTTRSEWL